MVIYNALGQKIHNAPADSPVPATTGGMIAMPVPANPAVQERMRELREKEAAAKADAEKMEQLRIEGIKREVEAKAVEWEADLLFEIEKDPIFTGWLRKTLQSPSAVQVATGKVATRPSVSRRKGPDGSDEFYIPVLSLYDLTYNVIVGKEISAAYTLENERMRLRYRVLAGAIASVRETIRTEELAEVKRLAEVARVAAEEKAAAHEAWVRRRQAVLDRYADGIISNMKTPYHSFTGVDPSNSCVMYVRYNSDSMILTLENLRIDASDTKIEHQARIACPPTMKAPASWNDMFEKGRLPFLTCCPVCSAQVTFEGITPNGQIYYVRCENHYSWDPVKNQNYKYKYVPRKGPPTFSHHISYHPEVWDPRDPDGSKAARAARDKKITETEAEIACLQAQLEALKKT